MKLSRNYPPGVRDAILKGLKQPEKPDNSGQPLRITGGIFKALGGLLIGLSGVFSK